MPSNHWIITNRRVRRRKVDDGFVERVDRDDTHAYPVFRVARYHPARPSDSLGEDDDVVQRVSFVKDDFITDYSGIREDGDPEQYKGTRQAFLQIYQQMIDSPRGQGDVLFFIHGYQTGWLDAVRHLQKLHNLYVSNDESTIGQIVLFSWPSRDHLLHYKTDQETARASGQVLGRLFEKVLRFYRDVFEREEHPLERCSQKIHLMAHSMGNQVLEAFVSAIRPYFSYELFGEILLQNADIGWTALERDKPLSDLPTYAERIHVYNNRSDDALRISHHTKNGRKRLGRQGPRDREKIPPRTVIMDISDADFHAEDVEYVPEEDPFFEAAGRVLAQVPDPPRGRKSRERIVDHWGYLYRQVVIADVIAVLAGTRSTRIGTRVQLESDLFVIAE
jgi:hypothetical protein